MDDETVWRTAATYVALATAGAWLLWAGGALLRPDLLVPLVLAGAWAPTVVAVVLTHRTGGRAGVRRLLGRLVRWRVGLRWYGLAVFGVPATVGLASGIHVLLGGTVSAPTLPVDLPGEQEYLLVPVVYLVNVVVGGPLAEELGWRGYLQPRLRRAVGVLPAGLAVGLVWGLWHLPFFVLPGGEAITGGLALGWFVALLASWSVVLGWVVDRTGSVLPAVLLHASLNTTVGTLGVLTGAPRVRLLTLLLTAVGVLGLAIRTGGSASRPPEPTARGR